MTMNVRPWARSFFTIWTGQAFSLFGSSAAQFAIVWWLTEQTGSASVLAMAGMAGFLPQALIGPFAGVWVDRLSRKRVMIAADLFIAAASGAMAVTFLLGSPAPWVVYLVLFLRAVGSVFHAPAIQAAMPLLVPESELTRTAAWSQFLQSGSYMAGPVLGALMMAAFPMPAIMLADIVGALIAVTTLLAVRIPDPEQGAARQPDLLGEMKEGLNLVVQNRALFLVTLSMTLFAVILLPVSSLFPLMVKGHFGGTAWHAGLVEFTFAGGMLVSSLLLGVWGGLPDRLAMVALSQFGLGASLAASGLLAPSAIVTFAAFSALMGFTGTLGNPSCVALVQSSVPPESLGRVFALMTSLVSLATPFGLFVAGPVAEMVGVATWFLISGVLILLTGIWTFWKSRGLTS